MKKALKALLWLLAVVILLGLIVGYVHFSIKSIRSFGWPGYRDLLIPYFRHLGIAILAVLAVVVAVSAVIGLQGVLTRGRARIFVSYKAEQQDLVRELASALEGPRLQVRYVPFVPGDHDTVLWTLRSEIRAADVLLVLPGPALSFVDAEVFAAFVLMKPVIFLQTAADQTTPDTALTGYPAFDLMELRGRDFRPLSDFVTYVCRLRGDTLFEIRRVSAGFGQLALKVMGPSIPVLWLAGVLSDVLTAVNPGWGFKLGTVFVWLGTALVSSFVIVSYLSRVRARLKAARVARQSINSGQMTYTHLERALSDLPRDQAILRCLRREPFPLRH